MAEGMTVKVGQGLTPARLLQFRELSVNLDLAAKIKLNILSTLSSVEIQEGLRNGTVLPDYKKQILTLQGKQIGTFTISEARIKEVG